MATLDEGLAAVAYGPSQVRARATRGQPVTIEERTDYPFREDIELIVRPGSVAPNKVFALPVAWPGPEPPFESRRIGTEVNQGATSVRNPPSHSLFGRESSRACLYAQSGYKTVAALYQVPWGSRTRAKSARMVVRK